MAPTLYMIGHSTRPIDEFIALLRQHAIATLVDILSASEARPHVLPPFARTAGTSVSYPA